MKFIMPTFSVISGDVCYAFPQIGHVPFHRVFQLNKNTFTVIKKVVTENRNPVWDSDYTLAWLKV